MGTYANAASNFIVKTASPYISLASSAYGAYETYQAGRIAKAASAIEARQVEDAARAEEIVRKRALIEAIAAQNAIAGSRGITTGGSFGAFQLSDIRQAQNDLLIAKTSAAAKMKALREKGRAYKSVGTTGAALKLFSGISEFGKHYVPGEG
jgi:3-methyladenine DNA glycosylase Tag